MAEEEARSTPIRQWRITITEDRDGRATHARLSWRTFPCAATHWDNHRWYTFRPHECSEVTSLDALKALLLALGAGDWFEGRTPRR